MTTQPTDTPSDNRTDPTDEVDQDSEPTNMAPPGERPSDQGPIAEASGSGTGDE